MLFVNTPVLFLRIQTKPSFHNEGLSARKMNYTAKYRLGKRLAISHTSNTSGCGRRNRTSGLRVMSPTSYRCSTPHLYMNRHHPDRMVCEIWRNAYFD